MSNPTTSNPERIVQPPRPPNAWILYRSDKIHQLPPIEPGNPRRAQAEVSKMISAMWKNESEAVRRQYEQLADARKAQHQQQYPGYRFQPMKKEDRERIKTEKRSEKEKDRAQSRRARHRIPYTPTAITSAMPTMIPIYPPEVKYGPAGPSPPLSAASSPEDDSPIKDAQPRTTPSSSRTTPYTPPNPASPTHPRTAYSVAIPQSQRTALGGPSRAPQHVPLPQQPERKLPEYYLPSPAKATPFKPHARSERANGDIPAPNNKPVLTDSSGWLESDDSFLRSMMCPVSDAALMPFPTIGPEFTFPEPTGELEVSMGTQKLSEYAFPPSEEWTAFAQDFFGPIDFPLASDATDVSSPLSSPSVSEGPSRGLSPVSFSDPDYDILSLLAAEDDLQQPFGAEMLQYLNLEPAAPQTHSEPPQTHPTHISPSPHPSQSTSHTGQPKDVAKSAPCPVPAS